MSKSVAGKNRIIIAIDGPAGSGKSTLASLLARRYHYTNIETGAMYRALALKAMQSGVSLDDGPSLARAGREPRFVGWSGRDGSRSPPGRYRCCFQSLGASASAGMDGQAAAPDG